MIISEFQTIANQILPCLDQPKLKVNFNITLNHDGYDMLSNIENINHTNQNGMASWQYRISPVSPNYFLFGILKDFGQFSDSDQNVTLWCSDQAHRQVRFMWFAITGIRDILKKTWNITEDEKNQKKIHFVIPGFRKNDLKIRGLLLYR